jgi:putative ubiquitin-RnfH superfamily antitoxin RatB of RatAB toxin-antitoxin module
MERADPLLVVELVYALADGQALCSVTLPRGSTIQDALERSGIIRLFPDVDFSACRVGVFGKVRSRDTLLSDGDRVEIYRPLRAEPKEARRVRMRQRGPRRDGI